MFLTYLNFIMIIFIVIIMLYHFVILQNPF